MFGAHKSTVEIDTVGAHERVLCIADHLVIAQHYEAMLALSMLDGETVCTCCLCSEIPSHISRIDAPGRPQQGTLVWRLRGR